MQIKKRNFIIFVIAAFLVGGLISWGICAITMGGGISHDGYSKLNRLYKLAEDNFYEEVDEDALMEGAYQGLIEGLGDPYSEYMTANEYENWSASATGEYDGVGVTIAADKDDNFIIIDIIEDSPASKSELKVGDIILKVDDKTYDNVDLIAADIRGKAGSEVKLTYLRDDEEKDITLTRETIVQHSVAHKMLDGDIGYIQINSFIESTTEDFQEALNDVEEKGAKGLILDLRDNGGGIVTSSVDIADEFLDDGVIVYTENRDGEKNEYEAEEGSTDLKTVVLVNENSASAAEILAAALQDNGFKLVGQTTYGKGVIQATTEFRDGSALKLTVMQYFSPDGEAINEKGVKPDYKVKNDKDSDDDAQLDKALSLF